MALADLYAKKHTERAGGKLIAPPGRLMDDESTCLKTHCEDVDCNSGFSDACEPGGNQFHSLASFTGSLRGLLS